MGSWPDTTRTPRPSPQRPVWASGTPRMDIGTGLVAAGDTVDRLRQIDEPLEPSAYGQITGIATGSGFTRVTGSQATMHRVAGVVWISSCSRTA